MQRLIKRFLIWPFIDLWQEMAGVVAAGGSWRDVKRVALLAFQFIGLPATGAVLLLLLGTPAPFALLWFLWPFGYGGWLLGYEHGREDGWAEARRWRNEHDALTEPRDRKAERRTVAMKGLSFGIVYLTGLWITLGLIGTETSLGALVASLWLAGFPLGVWAWRHEHKYPTGMKCRGSLPPSQRHHVSPASRPPTSAMTCSAQASSAARFSAAHSWRW